MVQSHSGFTKVIEPPNPGGWRRGWEFSLPRVWNRLVWLWLLTHLRSATRILTPKPGMHSLPWLFHIFRLPVALLREGEFPQGFLWGVAFGLHGALLAQDGLGEAEQKSCFNKNNDSFEQLMGALSHREKAKADFSPGNTSCEHREGPSKLSCFYLSFFVAF